MTSCRALAIAAVALALVAAACGRGPDTPASSPDATAASGQGQLSTDANAGTSTVNAATSPAVGTRAATIGATAPASAADASATAAAAGVAASSPTIAEATAGPAAGGAASAPTPEPAAGVLPPSGPAVDRIAYVGLDNHVYTVAPDGSSGRRITPLPSTQDGPAAAYTWPTWSPDARTILLSAAVPDPDYPGGRLVLYLADEAAPESGLRQIHQDRRGSEGILPGVFHYAIWSPDGKRIAIIAVGLEDLAVFVSRLDGQPARPLIAGAPMYVTWAWDSSRVFVHQEKRLMSFDVAGGAPVGALGASGRYQAPVAAASEGGRLAFVVDDTDGTGDIVIADVDGTDRTDVTSVENLTAIQWSPDGRTLAIGRTAGGDAGTYGVFLIADLDSGKVRTVFEGPIFAFEWSPDGRRILIAEHKTDDPGVLRWSVMDVRRGETRNLVDLVPSAEFGLMLVYFDQYSQSHRLWSPDGTRFVLAGDVRVSGAVSTSAPGERVWVIDAEGQVAPRSVAEGYLAFWSPR